jgi:hypothetical protein
MYTYNGQEEVSRRDGQGLPQPIGAGREAGEKKSGGKWIAGGIQKIAGNTGNAALPTSSWAGKPAGTCFGPAG